MDAEDDFDIGLLKATASLEPDGGSTGLPDVFRAKYADRIVRLRLTLGQFARSYSQSIRLTPDRALGWHGRSRPASIVEAARRLSATTEVSIAEPLVRGGFESAGEPLVWTPALAV